MSNLFGRLFGSLMRREGASNETENSAESTSCKDKVGISTDSDHQLDGQNVGDQGETSKTQMPKGVVDEIGLKIKQEMIEESTEGGGQTSSPKPQQGHFAKPDNTLVQATASETEHTEEQNKQMSVADEMEMGQDLNPPDPLRSSSNIRNTVETEGKEKSKGREVLTRKPMKSSQRSTAASSMDEDVTIVSAVVHPIAAIIKQEMIDDYLQSNEFRQYADYRKAKSDTDVGERSRPASSIADRQSSVDSTANSCVTESESVSVEPSLVEDYLQSSEFRQSLDYASGVQMQDKDQDEVIDRDEMEPGTSAPEMESEQSSSITEQDRSNPSAESSSLHSWKGDVVSRAGHSDVAEDDPQNQDTFQQSDVTENPVLDTSQQTSMAEPSIPTHETVSNPFDIRDQHASVDPGQLSAFVPAAHVTVPAPIQACTAKVSEATVLMDTGEKETRKESSHKVPRVIAVSCPANAMRALEPEAAVSMDTEEKETRKETSHKMPRVTDVSCPASIVRAPEPEAAVSMETEDIETRKDTCPTLPTLTPARSEVELSKLTANSMEEPVSLELKREMLEKQEQSSKSPDKRTREMAFGTESGMTSSGKKRVIVMHELVEKVVIDLTEDDEDEESQPVTSKSEVIPQHKSGSKRQTKDVEAEGQVLDVKVETEGRSAFKKTSNFKPAVAKKPGPLKNKNLPKKPLKKKKVPTATLR